MTINNYRDYDETSPTSIEAYGKKIVGMTFNEICDADDQVELSFLSEESIAADYAASHENKARKGGLGELVEERHFHYKANNDARPDFDKAGVELKVTPYKINKNGTLSAKERLILTMIDYFKVVDESFEESHFWTKSQLILLVYYLYQQEIQNRLDYEIKYVDLFTPPEQDIKIIKHDFEVIVEKIRAGKAHELSEGDTLYLGAATKAATSKDRRKQPFSDELAKPRAFSFKQNYMTHVLNNYIVPGKKTYESIIQDEAVDSFEDYVIEKINRYKGYSVDELCNVFEIDTEKKPKNITSLLAFRILGIKGNQAEEFEKANIVVKAIRVNYNNTIKENMSFPTFKFKELIQEEWEDSTFGNYLRETRFFFVIYKFDKDGVLRLQGCQFWNIPYRDLEVEVRSVWEKTKQVLIDGIEIKNANGRIQSNLPKMSENRVAHVRPHAKNNMDVDVLPDGRTYPKQCFWLNREYILKQIKNNLQI